MNNKGVATTRSNTFLANTFGNISFTSMQVSEVSQLAVVEAGAFASSEETLTKITFRWNYALTSFPFEEASCYATSCIIGIHIFKYIIILIVNTAIIIVFHFHGYQLNIIMACLCNC